MSKLTSQNARKKKLTYTSQLVNYHHQTIRQISARTIRSIIGEKTFYMHRTILYIHIYISHSTIYQTKLILALFYTYMWCVFNQSLRQIARKPYICGNGYFPSPLDMFLVYMLLLLLFYWSLGGRELKKKYHDVVKRSTVWWTKNYTQIRRSQCCWWI